MKVTGKLQGRFDSTVLEHAIKETVKSQGITEHALLKDVPDASCILKVGTTLKLAGKTDTSRFVCATSKLTSKTVCLTSYRSPCGGTKLLNSIKIWEACRATSAATKFFNPAPYGRFGLDLIDEATGVNNPMQEL